MSLDRCERELIEMIKFFPAENVARHINVQYALDMPTNSPSMPHFGNASLDEIRATLDKNTYKLEQLE